MTSAFPQKTSTWSKFRDQSSPGMANRRLTNVQITWFGHVLLMFPFLGPPNFHTYRIGKHWYNNFLLGFPKNSMGTPKFFECKMVENVQIVLRFCLNPSVRMVLAHHEARHHWSSKMVEALENGCHLLLTGISGCGQWVGLRKWHAFLRLLYISLGSCTGNRFSRFGHG